MKIVIDKGFPKSFNWRKELLIKFMQIKPGDIAFEKDHIVLLVNDKNDLVVFISDKSIYFTAPG